MYAVWIKSIHMTLDVQVPNRQMRENWQRVCDLFCDKPNSSLEILTGF